MKRFKLLLTLLFLSGFTSLTYSQNWDYEKYPKLDIELQHLNADIRIDELGGIQGDVLYRAVPKIDNTDSLVFDADRLNILLVSVNDEEKEFSIQNDHLVIYPEQEMPRDSVLNIHIRYEANPRFGVLRDVNMTTWTSQLPKSTRHWLPVIDHPRVQFTAEFVFTHPSGRTIVANGRRENSEVLNVNEEATTFVTNYPVPATALAWAFGDFSEADMRNIGRSGQSSNRPSIRIHLYSESGSLSDSNLTEVAEEAVLAVRSALDVPYPFDDLSIVVLDNDFWETKPYAAGVLFVYRNHGDIEQQIRRGVVSQWLGVHIREEQWSDADAVHAAHAMLANQLFDLDPKLNKGTEPYDVFSPYSFYKWENFIESGNTDVFKSSLQVSLKEIFDNNRNILGWRELSSVIYEKTGQPFFDGFDPVEPGEEEEQQLEYTANMEWNESDNTIQISFEAVGESVNELVTVKAAEVTFQDVLEHEVTFTGQSESSVITVSPGIENLKLSVESRNDIELRTEKPFMFWIYQLRNAEEPDERVEAAKALGGFTENPDLQLALDDILQIESDPRVYAEIVRSLSHLTAGASGTHERFLDYSSSQQHSEIRKAAIEALAYFQNNEMVISHLQNAALESGSPDIQREAIRSLSEVTDAARFNTIAENLITHEPVLAHVPFILQLLAEKGEEESAVELASTFITKQFPYEVRKEALEVMLQHNRSSENWGERLPELFTDPHPKIRYRAASALEFVHSSIRNSLLDQIIEEEYDARVRRVLESYE